MSTDTTSTKIIGFATEYFTLWNLVEIKSYSEINGKHYHTSTNWNYTYVQNLSKDEAKAVNKVKARYNIEDPIIDESLRGVTSSFTKTQIASFPYTVFPFGKLQCQDIATSDDVWQLNRVLSGEGAIGNHTEYETSKPARRKALARRRLVELGELVRYDNEVRVWDEENYEWSDSYVTVKYMPKREYDNAMRALQSKYLHSDGDKVELSLQVVSSTGYDSAYGRVHIITFSNENGENYIYKGSTPPDISVDEFVKVKSTIKHNTYNSIKQTLIQRIKIIQPI